MSTMKLKLLVGGMALAAAVVVLAVAGVREGWVYYLSVDQFVDGEQYRTQRVRLHGVVAATDFQSSPGQLRASFSLDGESAAVPVVYRGVIPDSFQPDREVVVEGRLDEVGVFQADTLMTKCASKYETEDGEAPHGDPLATEPAG
ncbi:MAG: cytochrome c maturation protein CcmE [Planctomycetota bacterium]|jgi:cytochrome c-type biogenesis protein CcmE